MRHLLWLTPVMDAAVVNCVAFSRLAQAFALALFYCCFARAAWRNGICCSRLFCAGCFVLARGFAWLYVLLCAAVPVLLSLAALCCCVVEIVLLLYCCHGAAMLLCAAIGC
jgi:Na+/pantothenate symporter